MITKEEVKIQVGKESKEVVDAIVELVKDIREGKDLALIAGENLPGLSKAIDGVDQVDDEMQSEVRNATVAYAGLQVADVLVPSKKAE